MATNDAELRIGANIDGLKSTADKAAAEIKRMAGSMESAMNPIIGVFSKVQAQFAAFAAVVAGSAAFKKSIDEVKEQTIEAANLGKQLGITANQANLLSTALSNAFISNETYIGAIHGITKAVNKNAEGFKEMGIRTRDASGHLLPMQEIIKNTVDKLEDYEAGSDRNIMANQLLGKSYEDVVALMKLNDQAFADAKDEIEKYHKTIDPQVVTEYRKATKDAGDAVEGVTLAVGRGAMPMFTQLSNWFSETGPAATEVTIVAMDTLRDVFDATVAVVKTTWSVISDSFSAIAKVVEDTFGIRIAGAGETFVNIMRMVRVAVLGFCSGAELAFDAVRFALDYLVAQLQRFAGVWVAAMHMDWSGVKSAWAAGTADIAATVEKSAQRMFDTASKYGDKISDALTGSFDRSGSSGDVKPKSGHRSATTLGEHSKKQKDDKSQMGAWEAELSQAKVAYQMENNLREMSKQEEMAFWNSKRTLATKTGGEELAISKKTADLQLEILKKSAKDKQALSAEEINTREKTANDELAVEEEKAQQKLAMGQITQQQMLALEQQFEDKRFEIQQQAQAERITAMLGDPNYDPIALQKLLDQMLEIQRAHALKLAKIQNASALETRKSQASMMAPITSAIEKTVNGMIQGTLTLKKALSNIFQSILGEFVSMGSKMVTKWMLDNGTMNGISKAFSAVRKMLFGEEAAAKVGADAIESTSAATKAAVVIPTEAGVAAAGAAASVAPTPFVGPALAAAAFAATMALVMGAMGGGKSASGGYDIPSGVNPLTQLHAEEMVLPAHIANPLRNSLAGGGGSGGDHFHVHAVDQRGIERLLRDNGHVLAKELRRQGRNFSPKNS